MAFMPTPTPPKPFRALAALSVAALAAASPTAAKPAPANGQLRPTAVRAAAVAQPGGQLSVRVVVSATGQVKQTAGVAVYLSKDGRRSKDDARLLAALRTPAFPAKGRTALTATVKLAPDQPLG